MKLIQNGTVFTMEQEGSEKLDILVEDGIIKQIAKQIPLTDEMEVIDATGYFVYDACTEGTIL